MKEYIKAYLDHHDLSEKVAALKKQLDIHIAKADPIFDEAIERWQKEIEKHNEKLQTFSATQSDSFHKLALKYKEIINNKKWDIAYIKTKYALNCKKYKKIKKIKKHYKKRIQKITMELVREWKC